MTRPLVVAGSRLFAGGALHPTASAVAIRDGLIVAADRRRDPVPVSVFASVRSSLRTGEGMSLGRTLAGGRGAV